MSNKLIIIGEVISGYGSYSPRIDDFRLTFSKKMSFISAQSKMLNAVPVMIGGIKERAADLSNLPVIIDSLYKADFHICGLRANRTPISDVLVAAKCVSDEAPSSVNVVCNVQDIPVELAKSKKPHWIIFTGQYADLIPLESMIEEAFQEKKIYGIVTNSSDKTESNLCGVHIVNPVFRINESSPTPSFLVIEGAGIHRVEIEHDAHIFEFKNVESGEPVFETSEFVRKLKLESDAIRDDSRLMDSHKNLQSLIEKAAATLKISTVAMNIVDNLMIHTNN